MKSTPEVVKLPPESSSTELDLCLVGGCGHVGLPLALVFAQAGLHVGVFDTDTDKVEMVKSGRMPFLEVGADALLTEVLSAGRLEVSSSPELLHRSHTIMLVVGTPIDEFLNPSLKSFASIFNEVEPHIVDGSTLLLRSTLYPGMTDWITDLLASRDRSVDVVCCPERIVEGRAIEEIGSLPQIIGSDSEPAAARAIELFGLLGVSTVRTSPKEAELAKLFTNSWRYIKFAIANEFFVIAQQAGVNYSRVLEAVRYGYPRAADLPGPGFSAGPCLLKDTMQLSAFDGHNFILGHAAMLVNEGLPDHVVRMLGATEQLQGRVVALLGMSFKGESDDIRDSLSYKLRRLLWFAGAVVLCTDPYVSDPELVSLDKALADAEIVIIGAPHSVYRDLDFGDRHVVDIWGATTGEIRL